MKGGLFEGVVSKKIEAAAVDVVSSRLDDDVDGPRSRSTKLGRIARRHHLEFLNRFLAEPRSCGARDVRPARRHLVVEIDTFQPDALVLLPHAEETDRIGGVPSNRRLIQRDPRRQQHQIHEVTVTEGQFLDALVVDDGSDRVLGRLDQRRNFGHGNRFGNLPDLQLKVDLHFACDRQDDAESRHRPKSAELHRHRVPVRRESAEAVGAGFICEGFARGSCPFVQGTEGRTRKHCTGRVGNVAEYRARSGLRPSSWE